jgi:hypothetical protein
MVTLPIMAALPLICSSHRILIAILGGPSENIERGCPPESPLQCDVLE